LSSILDVQSTAGLWLAVIGLGIWHGLNPGMGWPLAVSAAMFGKGRDLAVAMAALTMGHLAAMAAVLLPFTVMAFLFVWEREIRLGAGLLVVGFGVFLLIWNRHPRFLARIPPGRLGLWSFLTAIAHGAGLMLVPIYLGLCSVAELDAGHRAASTLMAGNAVMALAVSVVHALAMAAAGGGLAFAVHRWLGIGFVQKSWFNLDRVWAMSLILVGVLSLWSAVQL
jgi:hypothetical protein